MANSFASKKLKGFDKNLLLYGEGYVGKPITVNKSTVTGLTANEAGRYIINQGKYITGQNGSLLENPNQIAVEATVAEDLDTATINSAVTVVAKKSGAIGYVFSIVKGTRGVPLNPKDTAINATVAYTAATKKFVITLGVDIAGDITATYGDVVAAINNDTIANSYVVASLAGSTSKDTLAAVTATDVTTAGGGAETVTGTIDGILLHSVDVTDGEAVGALMIAGYVNMDNLETEPGTAVKAALPRITFGRID